MFLTPFLLVFSLSLLVPLSISLIAPEDEITGPIYITRPLYYMYPERYSVATARMNISTASAPSTGNILLSYMKIPIATVDNASNPQYQE